MVLSGARSVCMYMLDCVSLGSTDEHMVNVGADEASSSFGLVV